MQLNILAVFLFYSVCLSENFVVSQEQSKPSVLIVGSSIPSLISALILTDHNFSVTIQYSTPNVENQISGETFLVQDVTYRLPKSHPGIYEYSTTVRKVINLFNNSLAQVDKLYLHISDDNDMEITSDEYTITLVMSAAHHKCIKYGHVAKALKLAKIFKKYDAATYKTLYSNISLAQFAKTLGAPLDILSCLLKSALIDSGSQIETINAADAIARMYFYYFKENNALRSYHMVNPYNSKNNSKILIDQIVHYLKLKNTTFIANRSIEAFLVDTNSGRVLGDINNRTIKYDYIILGDNLNNSKRILTTTQEYNSGAPKIFEPLEKLLASINQYSSPPRIFSIKLWLSHEIFMNERLIMNINNSPFPFSIQSIKHINKLSGDGNQGNILEIIVADVNISTNVNWTKIFTEVTKILPAIKDSGIYYYSCDSIDTGVLMDTKYGMNRVSTSSLINLGIPNLVLAGDWVDTIDSDAVDLEKSFELGSQAALNVLKEFYFKESNEF